MVASGLIELGVTCLAGAGLYSYYNRGIVRKLPPSALGLVGFSAVYAAGVTYVTIQEYTALEDSRDEERTRERETIQSIPYDKLVYLAPIALAPLAHNFVTMAGSSRKPNMYIGLAVAATIAAVSQRLYLMNDAKIDSKVFGGKHFYEPSDA